MEFLLTYGWAILVVVIAVSAMSYFGVLSPTGLAMQPNQCTIDVGLTCVDSRVEYIPPGGDPEANTLHIVIRNNRGDEFRITSFKIEEIGFEATFFPPDIPLANDEDTPIELTEITGSNPVMQSGQRYNLEFEVGVINKASGLPHTYRGRITGKVD